MGFLSGLPLIGFSSENPDFPDVASGAVRASGMEMHRLLCPTCGQISAIYYVPKRDSFFLHTDQGDVWQINAQGYLVDVVRGPGADNQAGTEDSLRLSDALMAPDFSWADRDGPLYLDSFHREGRQRRPFLSLDFNGHRWSGVYGQGRFVLRHQGAELRFSAYHGRHSSGSERSRLSLFRLNASGHGDAEKLAFLVVRPIPYDRNFQQLGVYLVRPQPAAAPPVQSERYQQLNQYHELSLKFEGFDRHPGQLSRIVYVNGRSEEFDSSPLNQTHAAARRPAPLSFLFSHKLPGKKSEHYDYLELNGTFYELGDNPEKFSTVVTMEEQEVLAALSKLNALRSTTGPITLLFTAETMSEGPSYHVYLQRGDVKVPMKNARLSEREVATFISDKLNQRYDQERINQAYDEVLSGSISQTQFMSTAEEVAIRANLRPFNVSSPVVRLILKRLEAHDGERAADLYTSYIKRVYPHLGPHHKTTDVASMALVISLVYNKPDVAESAINTLLGGAEMNMKELQNEILLYNLACYYARHGDKPKLLEAAELAVSQGKTADQFLKDSDFTDYRADPDFLEAIGAEF